MSHTPGQGNDGDVVTSNIAERLQLIKQLVNDSAQQSGRDPATVRLVAVSKRKPISLIREAYQAGQRDFGENYSQELLNKAEQLADLADIRWHHIGHLQRNKVKGIIGSAQLLHAVDREALVHELDKRGQTLGVSSEVLLQINLAGEQSKSGCPPEQLSALLDLACSCEGLRVIGLMAIPPATKRPEDARPYFRQLRMLREAHGGAERLPELSMGMSQDFAIAIEEGATIVRVGSAIFGPRE